MVCYHPIPAYLDGDRPPRLWPPLGEANTELPCGSCIGCKQSKSMEWANRAKHEASLWEHNCFVTLTYADEHLPKNGHLQPEHLREFIRSLRRLRNRPGGDARLLPATGRVRYLACGEYGDRTHRPHYHVLLFNVGFADGYQVGTDLTESPVCAQLWPYGAHRIGALTGASANYVAQYTLKKIGKNTCDEHGEIIPASFLRMSLKPGIGQKWLLQYKNDLTHGYLVTDGIKGRIPRYYREQIKKYDPELYARIQLWASKRLRKEENLEAAERIHESRTFKERVRML